MKENTGGAGGFYRGVKEAYDRGSEWFWVMDDVAASRCAGKAVPMDEKF